MTTKLVMPRDSEVMKTIMRVFFLLLGLLPLASCSCGSEDSAMLLTGFTSLPTCTSRHISSALASNSRCSLHSVVVSLPWPNSTLVQQMTPTHVTVQRCGGGCHGTGQVCTALATKTREVSVMVGKCGVSVGKCEKECAVVSVTEDTECGCGCEVSLVECEAGGLHTFLPQLCQCQCRDHRAKQQCLQQGRAWNHKHCTCGCAGGSQCPPGWRWQAESCSCTHAVEQQEVNVAEGRRRQEVDVLSWEMVLITVLLALLAVLLALVVVLVARLRLARIKEKKVGRVLLVPSTLSGHYVPGPDPCSDLSRTKVPSISDTGSNPSKELTDSSLCSSEPEKEGSGCGSVSSLPPAQHGSQPCLQSVGLSRHLAIRPGIEGGSLRLARPPRHQEPSSHSGFQKSSSHFENPLPCPGPYYSGGRESPYNTVRIVYRKGERTMELHCQVDPAQQQPNITDNPCAYNM